MKKWMAAALALLMLCGWMLPAQAEDLFSGLSALNGLLGSLTGDTEAEDELPDLSAGFSGETETVKIAGHKVKVHTEFRLAMEKYEQFFDEYIRVMSDDEADLLEVSAMMMRYAEVMSALSVLDDPETEISEGDMLYYNDMMLRILTKLSDVE